MRRHEPRPARALRGVRLLNCCSGLLTLRVFRLFVCLFSGLFLLGHSFFCFALTGSLHSGADAVPSSRLLLLAAAHSLAFREGQNEQNERHEAAKTIP